jgi:ankyrin repeat protein
VRTTDKEEPLDIAKREGHDRIVKLLKSGYGRPHKGNNNPQQEQALNLHWWICSGYPSKWVDAHHGQWTDLDWLDLIEKLKRTDSWPMDLNDVAKVLEEHKKEKTESTSSPASQGMLHRAVKDEDIRAVRQMLDPGADVDVNEKDDDGYTPLANAAFRDNILIVKLLLDRGADANASNPLFYAVDSYEVVKLLLDNGADVNRRIEDGRTPLHAAVAGRLKIRVIELLLDRGADVNAKASDGKTPMDRVSGCDNNVGWTKVRDLLEAHGGNYSRELRRARASTDL